MQNDLIQARICRPEDLPDEIRLRLICEPQKTVKENGQIFLLIDQTVICMQDNYPGNELAYAINKRNILTEKLRDTAEVFLKLLNDPNYHPDSALLKQSCISNTGRRCTAVFRAYSPIEKDLYSIISSMAPVEKGDAIVPIDYQTSAFVKDLEGQTEDELTEFIEAVIGTMETEGITDVRAGIGTVFSDLSGIRNSCDRALEALCLGIKYHRQDRVYVYGKQTLEKIVDCIPDEQKNSLLESFFRQGSVNALSAEMLETVRVFFQNDLNLTAASKQLFIHRNTLNYRLDKINKEFGLDLRSFQDAVIFRIISEIAHKP